VNLLYTTTTTTTTTVAAAATATTTTSTTVASSSSSSSVRTNSSGISRLITIPTTNRIITFLLLQLTDKSSNSPSVLFLPKPERATRSPGQHSDE